MKTFSQKEVMERYDKLPQAVRDAIFAETTADKMQEIGKKYDLMLDAIGDLAQETGYVMVGLVHPGEFSSRISSLLGIPDAQARDIASDINDNVFKPIRSHLLQIYSANNNGSPGTFAGKRAASERDDVDAASYKPVPSMIYPHGTDRIEPITKQKPEKSEQKQVSDAYREPTSSEPPPALTKKIPPAPKFIESETVKQPRPPQKLAPDIAPPQQRQATPPIPKPSPYKPPEPKTPIQEIKTQPPTPPTQAPNPPATPSSDPYREKPI